MADDIGVAITGAREVALKFDEFPKRAHDGLLARISGLTDRLESLVSSRIPTKTGELKSKVIKRVYDDREKISGRVSFAGDFAKAAALEYGAHKSTKVRAHLQRLDHNWNAKMLEPTKVFVQAYTRKPDIDAVRFMRGALAEFSTEAVSEMQEAVEEIAESNS